MVVSDSVGRVSFKVWSQLQPGDELAIRLDVDSDGSSDFLLGTGKEADGSGWYAVNRWSGAKWEFVKGLGEAIVLSFDGGVEFAVKAAPLGITRSLAFDVTVTRYVADAEVGSDYAPDGALPWTYTLTSRVVTTSGSAVIGRPTLDPAKPRATWPLTASFALSASGTGARLLPSQVSVTATATLGGSPIRVRVMLGAGKAKVVVVPPARARRRTIVLRLHVTANGLTTTRTAVVPIA